MQRTRLLLLLLVLLPACLVDTAPPDLATAGQTTTLKEAKLNIEHNATDGDTGFQGFIDAEGWDDIRLLDPDGRAIARFQAFGALGQLGLTELFFESVEPTNDDVAIDDLLSRLPSGRYTFRGTSMEDGKRGDNLLGEALLTHAIPAGPRVLTPKDESVFSVDDDVVFAWEPVQKTIDGKAVAIAGYQVLVEPERAPSAHAIGSRGLSVILSPSTTSLRLPPGFLRHLTLYKWEVLAIEATGNQTLVSGTFRTH